MVVQTQASCRPGQEAIDLEPQLILQQRAGGTGRPTLVLAQRVTSYSAQVSNSTFLLSCATIAIRRLTLITLAGDRGARPGRRENFSPHPLVANRRYRGRDFGPVWPDRALTPTAGAGRGISRLMRPSRGLEGLI